MVNKPGTKKCKALSPHLYNLLLNQATNRNFASTSAPNQPILYRRLFDAPRGSAGEPSLFFIYLADIIESFFFYWLNNGRHFGFNKNVDHFFQYLPCEFSVF